MSILRHCLVLIALLPFTGFAGSACGANDAPPTESEPDPVVETADELMSAGMERIIPLRFSELRQCKTGVCSSIIEYSEIEQSVREANRIFRPAGIQFYIEKYNEFSLPKIDANIGTDNEFLFSEIKSELSIIFPQLPLYAWADFNLFTGFPAKKSVGEWMHAVQAAFEDNRRIHVWITRRHNSSAARPERGRGLKLDPRQVVGGWGAYSNLAHEIGHFLGLAHTFEEDTGPHPATGLPKQRSDRWDLMYVPATALTPPHFFSNKLEAATREQSLSLIEYDLTPDVEGEDTNCDVADPPLPGQEVDTVDCDVGIPVPGFPVTQMFTGDPGLEGIAREYPDGTRGKNVMAYDRGLGRGFFSESQIALMRAYLRWDVPFDQDVIDRYGEGFLGSIPNMGSRRPRLGHARAGEPVPKADFDNDGLRDVVVYTPPETTTDNGIFRVYFSSHGYSDDPADVWTIHFGKLGDQPVIADYNNDGRTDLAVYQPGGGLTRDPTVESSVWRLYCSTPPNPFGPPPACIVPMPILYGERGDTPQFGLDFDGGGVDLSVFRPRTGTWHFRNLSNSVNTQRTISGGGAGVVPLAGYYDCDDRADLAVYEPGNAKFKLMSSMDNWTATVQHQFDTRLVPFPTGAGEERAGPIALSNFTSLALCSSPVGGPVVAKARRSAALYYPRDASWHVIWTPTIAGASITECTFGSNFDSRDQPIAGLDLLNDKRTDYALFRTDADGASTIETKVANTLVCGGAEVARDCVDCDGFAERAWAVPDMTGDGIGEVMLLDQDAMRLRWFPSEVGWQFANEIQLESIDSIVL